MELNSHVQGGSVSLARSLTDCDRPEQMWLTFPDLIESKGVLLKKIKHLVGLMESEL